MWYANTFWTHVKVMPGSPKAPILTVPHQCFLLKRTICNMQLMSCWRLRMNPILAVIVEGFPRGEVRESVCVCTCLNISACTLEHARVSANVRVCVACRFCEGVFTRVCLSVKTEAPLIFIWWLSLGAGRLKNTTRRKGVKGVMWRRVWTSEKGKGRGVRQAPDCEEDDVGEEISPGREPKRERLFFFFFSPTQTYFCQSVEKIARRAAETQTRSTKTWQQQTREDGRNIKIHNSWRESLNLAFWL